MAEKQQPNLYEVLGVPRDAKNIDIGRAYNRYKANLAKDTTMPDHRRAGRMEEAFATLSDEQKRAAYDATLNVTNRKRESVRGIVFAAVIVIGFLGVVGGYFAMQKDARQPPPGTLSPEEVLATASGAVGRLQSVDMSGKTTPLALAFAAGEGTMLTSCQGITPGAQLMVNVASRSIPARVAAADDALGVCKLSISGGSIRTLTLTTIEPKVGDRVYVAKLGATGQVALADGRVSHVVDEKGARLVEPTMRANPDGIGAPLLDGFGRVVAVAALSRDDGRVRHVALPAAWITEINEPPKERKTQASGDSEPAPKVSDAPPVPKVGDAPAVPKVDLPAGRKEKLEKAFRPPPQVPDDL